jgi:hypothetical protein
MATVEQTQQKVQRMLAASFNDVRLTKSGYSLPYGSSQVFVEVRDWGKDSKGEPQTLIYLWAPLGREVKITPELYKWAATEGQDKYFGSVHVYPKDDGSTANVTFEHTLLGDFVDPMELETAVGMMFFSADALDDIVHDQFGGKRYTDDD